MLFFYLRHGDPIYDPDSLTPLGERQAEALAKRLSTFGIDKIYTSTSIRAQETARPTCEMLKKEAELLDFANEGHAWNDLTTPTANGGRTWLFHHADSVRFFHDPELLSLGQKWYDHPRFEGCNYEKGLARIAKGADELFASLGYEHVTGTGTYQPIAPNDKRVALFAHQGFGLAFLSCILDIPYPVITTHFDMCHTGMTVIDFQDWNGIVIPKVLMLSSDSHLYREGLPTDYNHGHRF